MYYMFLLASSSAIWTMISLLGRGMFGNAWNCHANTSKGLLVVVVVVVIIVVASSCTTTPALVSAVVYGIEAIRVLGCPYLDRPRVPCFTRYASHTPTTTTTGIIGV